MKHRNGEKKQLGVRGKSQAKEFWRKGNDIRIGMSIMFDRDGFNTIHNDRMQRMTTR